MSTFKKNINKMIKTGLAILLMFGIMYQLPNVSAEGATVSTYVNVELPEVNEENAHTLHVDVIYGEETVSEDRLFNAGAEVKISAQEGYQIDEVIIDGNPNEQRAMILGEADATLSIKVSKIEEVVEVKQTPDIIDSEEKVEPTPVVTEPATPRFEVAAEVTYSEDSSSAVIALSLVSEVEGLEIANITPNQDDVEVSSVEDSETLRYVEFTAMKNMTVEFEVEIGNSLDENENETQKVTVVIDQIQEKVEETPVERAVTFANPTSNKEENYHFTLDSESRGVKVYYSFNGEGLKSITIGETITVNVKNANNAIMFFAVAEEGYYTRANFQGGSNMQGIYTTVDEAPDKLGTDRSFVAAKEEAKAKGCTIEWHFSTWGKDYYNRQFKVQSDPIPVTVEYRANGRDVKNLPKDTSTYYIYDSVTVKNAPERKGYTFAGWKLVEENKIYSANSKINLRSIWNAGIKFETKNGLTTGKMVFEAQWIKNQEYRIQYIAKDNGTVTTGVETFSSTNQTIKGSEAIANDGYQFEKWTSDAEGKDIVSRNATFKPEEIKNANYYAWFVPNTNVTRNIEVEYYLDGVYAKTELVSVWKYATTVSLETIKTPKTIDVTNYIFENVSPKAENGLVSIPSKTDENIKVYYKTSIYTIAYNGLEGATITDNPTSYTTETETFILNNPTKEGYSFAGWTGTGLNEATTEVSIAKGSTGNREYTANWSINSYTVTYTVDGKQVGEAENYAYGAAVTIRDKYVKEGYTVSDWSTTADFNMPAEDVVITATSVVNSYPLTIKHEYYDRTETLINTEESEVMTAYGTSVKASVKQVQNYVFNEVIVTGMIDTDSNTMDVEGTMPANEVVIVFKYDIDVIGEGDLPNEIPDKYEIIVNYRAVNGTVDKAGPFYITLEKDGEWATAADGGIGQLTESQIAKATANYGYQLTSWSPQEPTTSLELTQNTEFVANFSIDESQTKKLTATVDYMLGEDVQEDDSDVLSAEVQVLQPSTLSTAGVEEKTYKGWKLDKITINENKVDSLPATVNDKDKIVYHYVIDESQTNTLSYTVQHYLDGIHQENDDKVVEESVHVLNTQVITVTDESLSKTYEDYLVEFIKGDIQAGDKVADEATIEIHYTLDKVGGEEDPDTTPDEIPDKYQIRISYRAVNGTVDKAGPFYITLEKDGERATAAEGGIGQLTESQIAKATANYGYQLTSWSPQEPTTSLELTQNTEFVATFSIDESQTKKLTATVDYMLGEDVQEKDRKALSAEVQVLQPSTLSTADVEEKTYKGWKLDKITINGNEFDSLPATVNDKDKIVYHYVIDESQTNTLSYTVQHYLDGIHQENDDKVVEESVHVLNTQEITVTGESLSKTYEDYLVEFIKDNIQAGDKVADKATIEIHYTLDKVGGEEDPDTTPDEIPDKYQIRISYRAVNGTVDKARPFYITLEKDGEWATAADGGVGYLTADQIASGSANAGYTGGTWNVVPTTALALTQDTEFVISYTLIPVVPPVPVTPGAPDPDPVPVVVPEVVIPAPVVPVPPVEEEIEEEETPEVIITPTPSATPETEEIVDPETPEAGGAWALINLIASVAGMLLAIVLVFAKHKKEEEQEESEEAAQQYRRSRIWKVVSVITAIISIIVFVLTENMRLPMQLVDKWTLLMVVFFVINAVSLFLGRSWKEQEDEEATQA